MRTILVIDANPELRSFVSDLLARAGQKVRQTADVREAPALLRAEAADLILTDLAHAHPGSAETLEAIRHEFRALEVIALSAVPHATGYHRLVAALGGRRTRAQPFTNRELMSIVTELIAGVAAHRAHAAYQARRHLVQS